MTQEKLIRGSKAGLRRVLSLFCLGWAASCVAANLSAATQADARMASWEDHKTLRETSLFKDVTWTAVGPRIQGGRIESVWSVKKRKSTLYCGVGSGNLWKSVNNGTTWKPIFESESTFSIAVVTVSDKDPNLVWVGTGEPQMSRSAFPGTGVFKSTDAGDTWQNMGLNDTHHISRVIIDPENNDVVYVAALGHLYSYNEERGVFKTTDGGKTWEKVLYISEKIGVVELAMDPSDNNTLYAVAWERDRKAWNNVTAGPGSALYKSTNAGKTWKRIGKGLPTGENAGRMGITIAASNPKVLYILCDHRGVGGEVYRSDDGGESWRKTHEGRVPTGVHFALCLIRVMPDNEDEIFIVAFNVLHSSDGGKTMTSITERTVPMLSYKADRPTPHCDNHDMFIDPDDPDRILLGTDGGLYVSHDRGKIWLHMNTLPIAEFYAISVDAGEPYRIWGGTQDNGMLGGEAKPMTLGEEHWYWDHRGDYYVTQIDPNNLDTLYTEGFHGSMERRNLKTGEEQRLRPGPAPEGEKLRFGWMAPFILSHYDSTTLYAGANYVFKSEDRGDNWTRISPDLTTNPGPERRGNAPFGTITSISESELKKGLLYAGTDDGQLHVTKDDGASWKKINKGLPDKWVSRVVASKYDEGTAFVSHTGYREDDFEAYLYMTTDFGETWTSIVNNMPSESINVIREDPSDKDILYVGTDLGAYCSIDKGKAWHSLCKTLPTCAVHDLALHAGTGDLVAGTHGRSAFVLHAKEIQKIKQEMREESNLRKANTESIKAEAKTQGASGRLDCSKFKPTKIQKGEWSSPSNTLRSERFDIFWGDKRSSTPWKDFPTDSPEYFDPREVLKTAEAFWTKAVDEMQVYRGDHYVPRDRLRIVIRGTWTTWRDKPDRKGDGWYAIGGGITEEEDGKKNMPGGHIIITPSASRSPYVVTHELTHALQTYAAWDTGPPTPPVDAAAWKVFGMTHESHATFIPLLAGIGKGKSKLCIATLATKHLRPGRKRPYQNWTWMQFLCDKENPRFYSRVIQDHRSLGMHPFASVKRRKKLSAKQFADYWFEHAQRNVTGDYTTPNIRLTIDMMRKDKHPLTVKMLPVASERDTFEVPTEFVPQRFAYNHILLHPANRKKGESHKISVTLRGKPNEDKSADWRFGFCVITSDDTPRYVGPASNGKRAAVTLAADDKQVYLVVMATPDNLSPFDSDNPKEEDVPRYPYTVKVQGAVPE